MQKTIRRQQAAALQGAPGRFFVHQSQVIQSGVAGGRAHPWLAPFAPSELGDRRLSKK